MEVIARYDQTNYPMFLRARNRMQNPETVDAKQTVTIAIKDEALIQAQSLFDDFVDRCKQEGLSEWDQEYARSVFGHDFVENSTFPTGMF